LEASPIRICTFGTIFWRSRIAGQYKHFEQ
jgi:hypothetical protein